MNATQYKTPALAAAIAKLATERGADCSAGPNRTVRFGTSRAVLGDLSDEAIVAAAARDIQRVL